MIDNNITRRKARVISIGTVKIGGDLPIAIQSMTTTQTDNVEATLMQINQLAKAGCQIVRLAVPNRESAAAFRKIKDKSPVPLVADIHFDADLAVMSIENGADKLRINPGNIGNDDKNRKVIDCARQHGIPIRIGVNSGSLPKRILHKFGGANADALTALCMEYLSFYEKEYFENICLSVKSSDVLMTVAAYRNLASLTDYPLHIGVTESGTLFSGTIKSSAGLGILLYLGIGDTIRISLTGDPVNEVLAARKLLSFLHLKSDESELVSCPTCGRCHADMAPIAIEVEKRLAVLEQPLRIAVMGCEVNGPGEAKEADYGIACAEKGAFIFKKGQIVGHYNYEGIIDRLFDIIDT